MALLLCPKRALIEHGDNLTGTAVQIHRSSLALNVCVERAASDLSDKVRLLCQKSQI
jgi:hypothetical protein